MTDDRLPRDRRHDYTRDQAQARRDFVSARTGVRCHHIGQFSFDPQVLPGNIENFAGVAQVPIGFAGPLLVHGDHAEGLFYVPMATTEGTLVASYNRGMRLTREAGGITSTVLDDVIQRSPVFVFRDARSARAFGTWIEANVATLRRIAEATTSVGKLRDIEQYPTGNMRWLRFNYTTGDAAGQNMVTKATRAACL